MSQYEKKKDYDWNTIRTVYITGTDSYRALCKKYDVPESTLMKRGRKEDWCKQRKEYQNKLTAKVREKTANSAASKLFKLQNVTDNLVGKMAKMSENFDVEESSARDILDLTKAVRELTAAIRNLHDLPTAAEKEAQKIARERLKLEKERLQIEKERIKAANDNDNSITVVFEGGEDLREGAASEDDTED